METPSNSRNLNDEVIASLNKIAEVKKIGLLSECSKRREPMPAGILLV